ncbi:MAG: hypothetical protein AB1466_00020 [Actinomycetota bacterium]
MNIQTLAKITELIRSQFSKEYDSIHLMAVTPNEEKLIVGIRETEFGSIDELKIHNSQPVEWTFRRRIRVD